MKLNCIFTDNMVFQARRPIRIFGEEKGIYTISFEEKTKTIVSNSDNWMIEFEEMEYGGPYDIEVDLNVSKTLLKNIMIGEVILCSGQSNIAFTVQEDEEKPVAKPNALIQTFSMTRPAEYVGLKTENGWVQASAEISPIGQQ